MIIELRRRSGLIVIYFMFAVLSLFAIFAVLHTLFTRINEFNAADFGTMIFVTIWTVGTGYLVIRSAIDGPDHLILTRDGFKFCSRKQKWSATWPEISKVELYVPTLPWYIRNLHDQPAVIIFVRAVGGYNLELVRIRNQYSRSLTDIVAMIEMWRKHAADRAHTDVPARFDATAAATQQQYKMALYLAAFVLLLPLIVGIQIFLIGRK